MLRMLVALFSGTLFGLGLAVSGMVDPAKVIGFLDVAGNWDPTLAFVMGGALLVTIPAFRLILKHPHPALANNLDRKSTRLNSSHANISYAVFCLKKKNILP